MGGDCRLCYHGVPCMLPNSSPPFLWDPSFAKSDQNNNNNNNNNDNNNNIDNNNNDEDDLNYWNTSAKYIKNARLNVNTRQVFVDDTL